MEYDKFQSMFDTNLMALSVASREAVKSMKADKIKGHIINISA
jgi:NAD(P)-dependent dehydrogenase (short-subunit alcohol dehydrogenase family)